MPINGTKHKVRKIELLAPARDADIAMQAILHGADAVYIGAPAFGARKDAANSIEDIARLVDFAHDYRVKVYATVNTILYDSELLAAERMIKELWRIGTDAVIVQDMGILRLDIPPVSLHASTQCDIRTSEKALFLEKAGFSQIVLARELMLEEIRDICNRVNIPVEVFVHGALCVSYSGRCHASYSVCGRSANRGECAQICRLPYTMRDFSGRVIAEKKHLLSLRDFNASASLNDLLQAGVSSFKIEGRLKDANYVKNITAYYRQKLDEIIASSEGKYERSSCGVSEFSFNPNPYKSFNRGFTNYFLMNRRPESIASLKTPKSMGEVIRNVCDLNNGDGISFFDSKGEYTGVLVNGIRNGLIIPSSPVKIRQVTEIHRTYDRIFDNQLSRKSADRRIAVDVEIDENGVTASDERGVRVRIPLNVDKEIARAQFNPRSVFEKTGNTIYRLRHFINSLNPSTFIPVSQLSAVRRYLYSELDMASANTYITDFRNTEDADAIYPAVTLDYRDNVANMAARSFYESHGVKMIDSALETGGGGHGKKIVMTCRHCILREIGKCRKKGLHTDGPYTISSGAYTFGLEFDCSRCEMLVIDIDTRHED